MDNKEERTPGRLYDRRPCKPGNGEPCESGNEIRQSVTGYLWSMLAVLSCPCHLPILVIVLSGTVAGSYLVQYWGLAALVLTGLFSLSVIRVFRAMRGK